MSSPFKIFMHKNSENLHLKLMGDFDHMSVYELVDILKQHYKEVSRIFVHTSTIENFLPVGCSTFQKCLNSLDDICDSIMFTGENAFHFRKQDHGNS